MTNRKNSTTLCVMLTASATLAILTVFAILSCTQPLDPGKTQPSISYPDSLHAIVAKPVEIMLERRSGGEPDSFSIFPELPSGIQINRQDGTISGTAEEVSAWRGYTIKADNSWGRGMDTIYFAVSPGAPTGITAVPYDGGRILVSWSRVFGADSYVVYRSGASDTTFEIVATPSDTLFWDTPGHDGEYRYAVSTRQGDAPLSAITAGNPVSFSINAAAPVLGEIPGQTIDEGGSFEPVDLVDYVTDIDTPDSLLQWNVQAQFLQTAVSEDHVLSISTPDSNWHGSDMVSIEVVDPDTLRSVVSVAFTVLSINDTPSISRPADIVLTDSTPAVEMNLFALIHDVETPDSLLTITIEAGDHLDVDRRDSILNIAARDVIWEGTDSLEITVEDPDGARVSEMIIVTIQKGNDAPRITAPDSYEIREGESFENVNLDAWVEDSDHSRDELSWETKRHNALIITISEDRHVTIDPPDEDWNGVDSSLFIVSDPLGATDSHLVKFIVHAVNDTPRILSTPLESAVQDSLYVYDIDAYDPEDDELVYELTTDHEGILLDTQNLRIEWTPTNSDVAGSPYQVALRISEAGEGGLHTEQSWSITVLDKNDYPVAENDSVLVDEDDSLEIAVLTNDSDPDGDDLEIHEIVSEPEHGAVIVLSGMAVRYVPSENFSGDDSFQYEIHDGRGGRSTATVYVSVTEIPDAPVGEPDTYTIDEDSALVVNAAAGVLHNDTDVDSDNLTAVLVENVDTGSLALEANGAFVYTPPDDYFGTVTFTYQAEDEGGELSEVTEVVIMVKPVEDPPRIEPVSAKSIKEGELLMFDVKANDPDGQIPVVTADALPGWAQFDDGIFSGIPQREDVGKDTAVFTASDGELSSQISVVITVLRVNRPPNVSIGGLVAGKIYASDETLELTASVTDEDGTISKVEFYTGSTKIGEDTQAPYSFTTEPLGYGEHGFYAVAVDDLGGKGQSDTVTVTGASWVHTEYNNNSSSYDVNFEKDMNGNIYKLDVWNNRRKVSIERYLSNNVFTPFPNDSGVVDIFSNGNTVYQARLAFHPLSNDAVVAIAFRDSTYGYNIQIYEQLGAGWSKLGMPHTFRLTSTANFKGMDLGITENGTIMLLYKIGRSTFVSSNAYTINDVGGWEQWDSPVTTVYPDVIFNSGENTYLLSQGGPVNSIVDGYIHFFDASNTLVPLQGNGHFTNEIHTRAVVPTAYESNRIGVIYRSNQSEYCITEFATSWQEPYRVDYADSVGYHVWGLQPAYHKNKLFFVVDRYNLENSLNEITFCRINEEEQIEQFPFKKEKTNIELSYDAYSTKKLFSDNCINGPIAFFVEGQTIQTVHILRLKTAHQN